MNDRIYKSKVDLWLAWLVIGSGVLMIGGTVHVLYSEGFSHPAAFTLIASSALYIAVMLGLAWPVTYQVTQTSLIIRSGLTKITIELSGIETIKPSRNPLSSPAWSLDRLRIDYRRKAKPAFILISPEDRSAFLNELGQKIGSLSPQRDKAAKVTR
jgi:hypothetical protein